MQSNWPACSYDQVYNLLNVAIYTVALVITYSKLLCKIQAVAYISMGVVSYIPTSITIVQISKSAWLLKKKFFLLL